MSRKSFWFEEEWPRDDPSGNYVFLGNAFLKVGSTLFESEWSDLYPKLAFSHREGLKLEREMVRAVMEMLGPAIARGGVLFALRPAKGGEFKPQREALDGRDGAYVRFGKANWNVDDYTDLFRFAQMSDGVFRPEVVPPLDWIYVESKSFGRLISPKSSLCADAPSHQAVGDGETDIARISGAVSKAKIERWFVEYLSKNPIQVSQAALLAAAKTAFPGITRQRFIEVLNENFPSDWSKKSGPKAPRNAR